MMSDRAIVQYIGEAGSATIILWAAYRHLFSAKPLPLLLALPGRFFKLCLILVTLGLLAGCGDGDPLAQASGPLFPLNAGHWQPSAKDLATPPNVVKQ